MLYTLKLIIIYPVVILFTSVHVYSQETFTIELNERLVLGNDMSKSNEYLFRGPTGIRTDSNGNIYISDHNSAIIRIFDQNGNYLSSIGNRGNGPGEFQEVTAFHIDSDDNLIVFDRFSQFFTIFSGDDRESFEVINPLLSSGEFEYLDLSPGSIHSFGDDRYLISYRPYSASILESNMFHVYDLGLNYTKKSIIPSSEIWDFRKPFYRTQVRSKSLFFQPISSNEVIVCPTYYEGELYRFYNTNSDGLLSSSEWSRVSVEGTLLNNSAFIEREPVSNSDEMLEYLRRGIAIHSISSPEGRFFVEMNNKCKGIAKLNNSYLLVFTHQRGGITYALNMDVYNTDNQLVYNKIIKNTRVNEDMWLAFRVLWSADNTIYVSDAEYVDGYVTPIVRIIDVNY